MKSQVITEFRPWLNASPAELVGPAARWDDRYEYTPLLRGVEPGNDYQGKRRARVISCRAIQRGELVRGPCEQCGASKVEGHHDDYSKPLQVRWLCRRCHRMYHSTQNQARALALKTQGNLKESAQGVTNRFLSLGTSVEQEKAPSTSTEDLPPGSSG